jgi:hypothetical protein
MAEILEHPNAIPTEDQPWNFPDGSSVFMKAPDGQRLTVSQAIYMLEDIKFRILSMTYNGRL